MYEKTCVENGKFFYFNNDGKLVFKYIQKILCDLKNHQLFLFNVLNLIGAEHMQMACVFQ